MDAAVTAVGLAPRKVAPRRSAWLAHAAAKPVLFVLSLLPAAWLLTAAAADWLGANPAEALIRATGDWTLRLLLITLAVTPLRQWFELPSLARFRRMLGLFAFFYGVLHFLSYAWLDMAFELDAIARDIPKRPFALVGFLALLLMVPLAATSFNRAIKMLGAARWQALHRMVYAIALLGIVHFFWVRAAKNNFAEVAVYAVVVAVLLGWRLRRRLFVRPADSELMRTRQPSGAMRGQLPGRVPSSAHQAGGMPITSPRNSAPAVASIATTQAATNQRQPAVRACAWADDGCRFT